MERTRVDITKSILSLNKYKYERTKEQDIRQFGMTTALQTRLSAIIMEGWVRRDNFNPRPRAGGDQVSRTDDYFNAIFQSTPPCRGRRLLI